MYTRTGFFRACAVMSAEGYNNCSIKKTSRKETILLVFDCIPECKSAFYCFLLFHVTGKESKLALVYLNFRKMTAKIEDG